MKITKIVPQRFKKEYVTIFFEGGSRDSSEAGLRVHKEIAARYALLENMEIEPTKVERLKSESQKKEALEYALLFLSYRSRSEKEMTDRLRKKGFSPETITATLEELKNRKLLNDFEFAKNLMESRAKHKQYGNYRIIQELRQKGINSEVAEALSKELENDASEEFPTEEERATKLLEKRAEQMKNLDYHTAYRRLHTFLLRKGFSYDTVEKVMNWYAQNFSSQSRSPDAKQKRSFHSGSLKKESKRM